MLTRKSPPALPPILLSLALLLVLGACVEPLQPMMSSAENLATPQPETPSARLAASATLNPSETASPSASPSPTPALAQERARIETLMRAYGQLDPYQLSDTYWQAMAEAIAEQGTARRIIVLEYHSDSYTMFGGAYAMTPASFHEQLLYLLENDYHFVSIHEALGFAEGWLQLPARSVLLSSDPHPLSHEAVGRMLALFSELEETYGVKPYVNLFVLTQGLGAEENPLCAGDICWQAYRDASQSGYFSINSHGHYHAQPGTLDAANTLLDIQTSLDLIEARLGLRPYALSWPYEACSPYPEVLEAAGIQLAFAGWTRALEENYLYPNDAERSCLPRMLPPNPDGLSIRPDGQSLEQILQAAMQTE